MRSVSTATLGAALVVLTAWMQGVNAAISILDPNSQTTWYTNNTVTTTWSSASTDPSELRILLGNPDNSSLLQKNASLAQEVPTANNLVTILLPQIANGRDVLTHCFGLLQSDGIHHPRSGYVLYFVNQSNVDQVYATSQPFTIAQGMTPSSTSSMSSAAASATSDTSIPGLKTSAQPFSATSSGATASSTSKSGAIASAGPAHVGIVATTIFLVLVDTALVV